MPSFYDIVIRNSTAFRSSAICKDLTLLEPGTRAAVLALLAGAKAQGIDLRLLGDVPIADTAERAVLCSVRHSYLHGRMPRLGCCSRLWRVR